MATTAAVLSVTVDANTTLATAKLTKFDKQLEAVNLQTKKGIEARLGASYNPEAFNQYEKALTKASERAKSREAFKAELGADFNNRAFNQYQRAVEKAGVESKVASEHTGKLSGALSGVGTKALGAATALTGVGFGVVEIGKSSLTASANFQQAMEQIHTQAGASQKEVKRLSGAVQALAPSVATGPAELAKGLYHLESQGLRSAKAMGALKTAAEGAKVGNANLEDVTNALGGAIASGISGVHDMRKAMGAMNAIVGAGDMRMQDLADAFGTGLLGPMKRFGVSLKDVGAALAVFGDNNIRGADAGTKLLSTIRIMAAPSNAAAKVLASIGLSATQLADDIRKNGLVAAFEDLKKHLDDTGVSASNQARILAQAFGGRQSTGVQLLLGQLDRLKTKEGEVGQGATGFGQAFAATAKTTQFKMDQMRAAFETAGISIGNALVPLLPTFVKIAQGIAGFIRQMQTGQGAGGQFASTIKSAFDTIKSVVGSVVDAFGGLKQTIEIALAAFAAYKIYAFAGALSKLFVLIKANPIGIFLTVVGGLATAFGLLSSSQSHAAASAQDVADAWNNARDAANGLRDAGIAVIQAKLDLTRASRAENDAQAQVNKLAAEGKTGSREYKDAVLNLKDAQIQRTRAENGVKDATDNVKTSQQKATQATQDAIQTDKDHVSTLKDQIKHLALTGGSADQLNAKFQSLRSATQKLTSDQSSLNRALNAMPEAVTSMVKVSVDFLSNVPGAIASMGAGAAKGISSTVGHNAIGGVVNKPGYFAGEEAPRHPEVILATNPAYRSRNVGLWQQAGGMLGIPGFALGGIPYANAGREVRQVDPWAIRHADAWIKPIARAWGVQHSTGGRMIGAANSITGLPYTWGGGHGGFFGSPGFDCSGAVSYVLHAGGLLSSPVTTDGLKGWGEPGAGKFITVGVRGTTGRNAHTMMSMFGKYFESGGSGGGPHWDAGWDGAFPIMRHPAGFAQGGIHGTNGEFGDVPPRMLLAMNPTLASNPAFWQYAKNAPSFAKGGWWNTVNHQYPKHFTGTPGATFSPNLVAKIAEWAGMPGITMAQIAHGESSYMPGIVQAGQDYAHTGWGLWQITPGNSVPSVGTDEQLLNPLLNAKAAAVKYKAAKGLGNALSPWFGTKYLTDTNAHYTGALGVSKGSTSPSKSSPPPRTPRSTGYPSTPAVIGLRHAVAGKLNLPVAGLGRIPSQATGQQIQMAGLANTLTRQQNQGAAPASQLAAAQAQLAAATTPAEVAAAQGAITTAQAAVTANNLVQAGTTGKQLTLEKAWLAADKAKLRKINQGLKNKYLSPKGRRTLLADKLAVIQEIGTITSAIGADKASIANLTAAPAADTSAFDNYTAAIQAQADAMTALTAALDANVHYMQAVGAVETSQAIKALSDVISGQIGGQYISRATGSAGDGSVARYGSVARA